MEKKNDVFDIALWFMLIGFILFCIIGNFIPVNDVVTKDNISEFRTKYIGKTEQEIKKEFGTPGIYSPPNKSINVIGAMSYNSEQFLLFSVLNRVWGDMGVGGINGLYYKNKMDMKDPVVFYINQKLLVVGVGSTGEQIDGVDSPKVNVNQ